MSVFIAADYGVIPDAQQVQTAAIQQLINRCAASGGGRIVFSPGTYVTGTLRLCDNLELVIEPGATLAGSADPGDYLLVNPAPVPFFEGRFGIRALLFAYRRRNIAIGGGGTIDGCSPQYPGHDGTQEAIKTRPRIIWFGDCANIAVTELNMCNSNFWAQHYIQCRNVVLRNLEIYNHGCLNNDGIDIDSCDGVLIEKCRIDSSDDAICLKCGTDEPCRNVTVRDCETRTYFGHFKLGTETNGGFAHIRCSNLQMLPSRGPKLVGRRGGVTGIALSAVDGAFMDDVEVKDISMQGTGMPILMRFGDRRRGILGEERGAMPPRYYRNVTLRNIQACGADPFGCYICGLKDHPMRGIRISDSAFAFAGNFALAWHERKPPEAENVVPCTTAFGDDGLPAYLWTRYAEVELDNVQIVGVPGDPRPAVAQWEVPAEEHSGCACGKWVSVQ